VVVKNPKSAGEHKKTTLLFNVKTFEMPVFFQTGPKEMCQRRLHFRGATSVLVADL